MNDATKLGRTERKELRKSICRHLMWYSVRGSARDGWQYLFDHYLCVFFWKKRLTRSLEYTRNLVRAVTLTEGAMIDYTPDGLSKVDEVILEWRDDVAKGKDVLSRNLEWAVIQGIGSYFGEVVIQDLGGTWVFPSRTKLWEGRIRKDMSIFYDRWYVESSGRRIHALKIARLLWEGNHNAPSLAEVYRQISSSPQGSSDQLPEVSRSDDSL